jgi:hypothetical protein
MLETIEKCESLTGREMQWSDDGANRAGDHIWWISDIRRFRRISVVDALRLRCHPKRDRRRGKQPSVAIEAGVMSLQVKSLAEREKASATCLRT